MPYTQIYQDGKETLLTELPEYTHEPIELSDNGRTVLEKRYLRKGPDGKPVEDIPGMFYRVAHVVAGGDESRTEEYYALMSSLLFLPNSPTFTGAGTPLAQLAACFVLKIEDDLTKGPESIFGTMAVAARIQQTGGGNGFSFGRLRPRGDKVSSSQGIATGPVAFMEMYDKAFGTVAQGGSRRGANMGILPCHHPDIEEFITSKAQEGDLTNFNISVNVTDEFMRAVENGDDFDLINPRNGEVTKTVDAGTLFRRIATLAHRNGEPGVVFLDRANDTNPVPHLYTIEATNPCSEQALGPNENCCLGSINLARHVDKHGSIDWELLTDTIWVATEFLDNVVDANKYVPELPQIEAAAKRTRRLGLGVMGLADMMYKVGVGYDTDEGRELAAQVMEFIEYHSTMASVALAFMNKEPFPAIKGSIYDPDNMTWQPPASAVKDHDWGRPDIDWGVLVNSLKIHGIRNATRTTIAPTGTLATVAGCEGYGCEPVFALGYVRHFKDGDKDVELNYVSPLFEREIEMLRGLWVKNAGDINDQYLGRVLEEAAQTGQIGSEGARLPFRIRNTFVVSGQIAPEDHVKMQATLQKYVDNAISKTCNLPHTATVDDIQEIYMQAWKSGCKGITVYVKGSRQQVVLETKASKPEDVVEETSNNVCGTPGCAGTIIKEEGCERCTGCEYSACSR